MDAKDMDDAIIEAKKYAAELDAEFEAIYHKDRPRLPQPTLDNYPAQINVLDQLLQQLTSQMTGKQDGKTQIQSQVR